MSSLGNFFELFDLDVNLLTRGGWVDFFVVDMLVEWCGVGVCGWSGVIF